MYLRMFNLLSSEEWLAFVLILCNQFRLMPVHREECDISKFNKKRWLDHITSSLVAATHDYFSRFFFNFIYLFILQIISSTSDHTLIKERKKKRKWNILSSLDQRGKVHIDCVFILFLCFAVIFMPLTSFAFIEVY